MPKNYDTVFTSVKVMQKKPWPLFFPDTVYIQHIAGHRCVAATVYATVAPLNLILVSRIMALYIFTYLLTYLLDCSGDRALYTRRLSCTHWPLTASTVYSDASSLDYDTHYHSALYPLYDLFFCLSRRT